MQEFSVFWALKIDFFRKFFNFFEEFSQNFRFSRVKMTSTEVFVDQFLGPKTCFLRLKSLLLRTSAFLTDKAIRKRVRSHFLSGKAIKMTPVYGFYRKLWWAVCWRAKWVFSRFLCFGTVFWREREDKERVGLGHNEGPKLRKNDQAWMGRKGV